MQRLILGVPSGHPPEGEKTHSDEDFSLSDSALKASANICTCLLQLLVGIPVPHILVFVIRVRIALPEKTNTVRRRTGAGLS